MPLNSPENLFIGKHIVKLNEIGSTNTFALALLRNQDLVEGSVIIANSQSKGRGQRGSFWTSEPGKNITVSIIFKPGFLHINLQFDLTRVIALGICDLLEDFLPDTAIHIKWPNDIIANGKKVAGILIENIINGNRISTSVAGIGLNVNQSDFGKEIPNAVSLFHLAGKEFELEEILKNLFANIEARYLQLRAGQAEKLRNEYHAKLFMRDVLARYTDFKTVFDAKMEYVTPEGILVLRDGDGVERKFGFKEVGVLY